MQAVPGRTTDVPIAKPLEHGLPIDGSRPPLRPALAPQADSGAEDLPPCHAFREDFSGHAVAFKGSGDSGVRGDVDERFDELLRRNSQIQGDPQLPSQRLSGTE